MLVLKLCGFFGIGTPSLQQITWPKNNFGIPLTDGAALDVCGTMPLLYQRLSCSMFGLKIDLLTKQGDLSQLSQGLGPHHNPAVLKVEIKI